MLHDICFLAMPPAVAYSAGCTGVLHAICFLAMPPAVAPLLSIIDSVYGLILSSKVQQLWSELCDKMSQVLVKIAPEKSKIFFAGLRPAPRWGSAPDPAGAPPQTPAGAHAPDPKFTLCKLGVNMYPSP